MWDLLAASIPAVTPKHLESSTTRAGFAQARGAAVDLGEEAGVAATVADAVAVGEAITLGDAATGAADPVEACGLAHAATASDIAITVSRTCGPVVIP
jgi:hypothetical protein